jgi:hypothetical protein
METGKIEFDLGAKVETLARNLVAVKGRLDDAEDDICQLQEDVCEFRRTQCPPKGVNK